MAVPVEARKRKGKENRIRKRTVRQDKHGRKLVFLAPEISFKLEVP